MPPDAQARRRASSMRRQGGVRRALAIDACCLAASYALAVVILGGPATPGLVGMEALALALAVVAIGLVVVQCVRLADLDAGLDGPAQVAGVLKTAGLHFLASLAGADLLGLNPRPEFFLLLCATEALLLCVIRAAQFHSASARGWESALLRRILLVGSGDEAAAFCRTVSEHPQLGLRVVGVAGDRGAGSDLSYAIPRVGKGAAETLHAVDVLDADAVFVMPGAYSNVEMTTIRRVLAQAHVPVHVVNSWEGVSGARLHRARIGLTYFSHVELEPAKRAGTGAKRAVDLVFGTLITLAALPIMAIVALTILVLDGRPVLFSQTRVGRDLKPFRLLKFRTMVPDAESRVAELSALNERQGPLFKLTDDPRVTRSGRLLRATSLDELPQLFNVLLGHMSLVGPRPAMPAEVADFDEELRSRHRLRPGVTGLWQVRSRDSSSFDSYRHLDLFYVENWSITLDLWILACTGPAVVARALTEGRGSPRSRSTPREVRLQCDTTVV